MLACYLFLSNNPAYTQLSFPEWNHQYLETAAITVLQTARDKIHLGYKLMHHPLYGNFRPKHQPYRSLLLKTPSVSGTDMPTVDNMSLHLIEEALTVYNADRGILPSEASQKLRQDCGRIDFELMYVPLCQAGWSGEAWKEEWISNFA